MEKKKVLKDISLKTELKDCKCSPRGAFVQWG